MLILRNLKIVPPSTSAPLMHTEIGVLSPFFKFKNQLPLVDIKQCTLSTAIQDTISSRYWFSLFVIRPDDDDVIDTLHNRVPSMSEIAVNSIQCDQEGVEHATLGGYVVQLHNVILKPRVFVFQWNCIKCWPEIHKRHSDVGVIIFKVCEYWVEMQWRWHTVYLLALNLVGWHFIYHVLENQFIKVLYYLN